MAEPLRKTLEQLNALLASTGVSTYKLGVASPHDLKLLDELEGYTNARFVKFPRFAGHLEKHV